MYIKNYKIEEAIKYAAAARVLRTLAAKFEDQNDIIYFRGAQQHITFVLNLLGVWDNEAYMRFQGECTQEVKKQLEQERDTIVLGKDLVVRVPEGYYKK